jgi:amidophosphoribosyltransferase
MAGSDTLGFLSVENLHQIAPDAGCGFCDGCFTEHYPLEIGDGYAGGTGCN